MSLLEEQPNLLNLFSHSEEDEELNLYPKPFEEDTENFKFFPEIKEEMTEKPTPLFANNENFINYFLSFFSFYKHFLYFVFFSLLFDNL